MRYHRVCEATKVLTDNGLYPKQLGEHPWYDRLPFLDPPARVEFLWFPAKNMDNLDQIVAALIKLDTLYKIQFYDHQMTAAQLEQLSQVKSIKIVFVGGSCSDEQVRALLSLPLEEFTVDGPDVRFSEFQLRMLVKLKTIKKLGTAYVERDVPADILEQNPNIEFESMDIW